MENVRLSHQQQTDGLSLLRNKACLFSPASQCDTKWCHSPTLSPFNNVTGSATASHFSYLIQLLWWHRVTFLIVSHCGSDDHVAPCLLNVVSSSSFLFWQHRALQTAAAVTCLKTLFTDRWRSCQLALSDCGNVFMCVLWLQNSVFITAQGILASTVNSRMLDCRSE